LSIVKDNSISFPINHKGRSWRLNIEANTWDVDETVIFNVPRTRTGDRMPKWRTKVENGQNATTPMTATFCSADYTRLHGCYIQFKDPGNPGALYRRENENDTFLLNSQTQPLFFTSSVSGAFVDNLARAAFYKKLKLLSTQFQGYTFAGELRETLRMLRRPLVGIRGLSKDFLDTLRKRKRADPKKWLSHVGEAWLEQSFGWNPLINDVKDAVKAYQRLVKPVQTLKISASAKKSYDVTKSHDSKHWPGVVAAYDSGCTFHTLASYIIETQICRYRGALVAQVNAPSWQNKDLFGFEPQNFIPTAWELLPWSFLADYFTNIGDILDASITSTRRLAWVNQSVIAEVEKYGLFRQVYGNPPGAGWVLDSMSNSQGFHRLKAKYVARMTNVGMSLPTLQFNFDLTDGQLANVAALLSQANALHPQHNPSAHYHR
jgi:hypothetical protein